MKVYLPTIDEHYETIQTIDVEVVIVLVAALQVIMLAVAV